MASDWIDRDDLNVYVIAGSNKGFEKKVRALVEKEADEGQFMRLDGELQEWVIARVQGDKRTSRWRTPASKALWRAFRALAASQYHLREHAEASKELRGIRAVVERLWQEHSPHPEEEAEEAAEAAATAAAATNAKAKSGSKAKSGGKAKKGASAKS